eukprot:TRINITY_DN1293_c0_g2_i7.p1 TRINITY_DN1293_c0_g2~~TRINITY_DN1293_c0_g2_i7.p1  ORF type:complete len:439 (+),score=51.65 TRINITY_DN1293_c0_g2_i7:126-1442(+)
MNVRIKFTVRAITRWGDTIYVVGNVPELGSWNPYNGVRMRTETGKYPLWESDHVNFSLHGRLEYKYVNLTSDGSISWECGYTPKNRFVNPRYLQGFKAVAFYDSMFSCVLGVRKIEAAVENVPREVREEDPKIKLTGIHEQLFYVDLRNKILDVFSEISIKNANHMVHSFWIPYKGNIFCIGGSSRNLVHNNTYKFTCDLTDESEGERKINAIKLIYVEMAPMVKPRCKHKGIVVGKLIYVVGGNADYSAERYDIEKDKWALIPSNSRDFSNGTLTLIDERYLLVARHVFRTRNTPSDIYAERLDLLDEESGWESLQLNLEPLSFEPHDFLIQQAGIGNLSVLVTGINRSALFYLFSMDRNEIIQKDVLSNLTHNVSSVKYEQGYLKWYCFYSTGGYCVHYRLIKGEKPTSVHCAYNYLWANGMEVSRNVIELKAVPA